MATLCARYSTAYNTRHGISTSKARGSSVIVRSLEPHARHVPLQGGNAFWLLDPLQDRFFNVHGPSFIIQRPETYAKIFPKLRLRKLHQRHHDIQLVPKHEASTALIRSPLHSDLPTVYENQPVIDVTQLLEEIEVQQEQQVPAAPTGVMACSTFQGLVQVPGPAEVEGQQEVYVGSSTSPRRTKMVGFTCLRCKARSYKPVNPLAFKEGTLVVQCGKCQCWHKIKDHLHLFHDMCGDVFFRASPITEADLPESLRLPLEPFYWHNDN